MGTPDERAVRVGVNLTWLRPDVVGGSEYLVVGLLRAVLAELAASPGGGTLSADGGTLSADGRAESCGAGRPCDAVGGRTAGSEPTVGTRRPIELVLYLGPGVAEAHPDLPAGSEAHRLPAPDVSWSPLVLAARVMGERTWLRRRARLDRIDVLHHMGGTLPDTHADIASVVTVHDLQPLEFPERFGRIKRRWLSVSIPRVARADRLHVTTRFVADGLQARFGIGDERLVIAGPGSGPLGAVDTQPETEDPATLAELGVHGRFVLFPAVSHPHKGHLDLIDAIRGLEVDGTEVHLVMCGGAGRNADRVAAAVAGSAQVTHLGRVSARAMIALYRQASALTFASEYEGFGMPVLEAMTLGTPVIASDLGALGEVTGGAGRLVPVGDREAWRAAITDVLADSAVSADLIRRGHEVARQRSWAASARTLLDTWAELGDAGATRRRGG